MNEFFADLHVHIGRAENNKPIKITAAKSLNFANIAKEYATKRYRSNLINWGMLPFIYDEDELPFKNGDYIFVKDIKKSVEDKIDTIKAYVVGDEMKEFELHLGKLTDAEREIIVKGCLINYYRSQM